MSVCSHLKLPYEKKKTMQCATYCTLVQERVVELHKLLLGLFGTEGSEEVSMEVTELRGERQAEEKCMSTSSFYCPTCCIKKGSSCQDANAE